MRRLVAVLALVVLAGCGDNPGPDKATSAESDRVPITQRAIAAVALDHLPKDTSTRQAMYTEDTGGSGLLGADLRYNGDGESDGDLVQVAVSRVSKGDPCEGSDGCTKLKTDDGTMFLGWDEVEPEEDPGYVSLLLRRDGEQVAVSQSGEEITGDPREQKLAVSVDDMVALVEDPRLRLMTSEETVRAGEELSDWEGGEPDPDAKDAVPGTDRSMATAYLTTRGGYGDYSTMGPSPLKGSFGNAAIGARLKQGLQGTDKAEIDLLAAAKPPAFLREDPCDGAKFRGHCQKYAGKKGAVDYLLWVPGKGGEVWAVQLRRDQAVAFRYAGKLVPEKRPDVEALVEWYLLKDQLDNPELGLTTTKEAAEPGDATAVWRD